MPSLAEWLKTASPFACEGFFWGVGDHGGGASRKDLQELEQFIKSRPDLEIRHSTPQALFNELAKGRAGETWKKKMPISKCVSARLDDRSNGIHHAIFGARFREQAQQVGARCRVDIPHDPNAGAEVPRWEEFILEALAK